jgi:hypothetical protein
MVTERKENIEVVIRRIIAERLIDFDVPGEVITNIRDEILAAVNKPEKKPFGATVMTPEASLDENVRPQIA